MRLLLLICTTILMGFVVSGCGDPEQPEPTPPGVDASHNGNHEPIRPILNWPVPNFTFKKENGRDFGLEQLRGKIWVANFIFIRCAGPCPDLTRAMGKIQATTKDIPDLHLVTFSVDPARDMEAELLEYGKKHAADFERWSFLRGTPESVASLQSEGFKLGDPSEPANHSTRFALIDRKGRIQRYYDAREETEREALLADLKELAANKPLR